MTVSADDYLADASATARVDRLNSGLDMISASAARLANLRNHWHGTQNAAFLSRSAVEALDHRLRRLAVNFPRLAVLALSERMRLSGIVDNGRPARPLGSDVPAEQLWEAMTDAGLMDSAACIITDRLYYGTAYATVWATEYRRLTITADNPQTMVHASDPATNEVEYAVRAWSAGNTARSVLYEPDAVTIYRQPNTTEPVPSSGWIAERVLDNPLGVVPVVPFVRRISASDSPTGDSVVADVLDLSDAVGKLLADAMVTSEFYARPRRWATGLEIEYADDGTAIDPFGNSRLLQSEAPETRFGQFDGARADGYTDLVATMTQQIGALTGLPATYLGLHGDQPASAEGVKAAEVQLTMRARSEAVRMKRAWCDVAWLSAAVLDGAPVVPADRHRYEVTWESPEVRTQAQAADAAAKLRGIGVPLAALLVDPLGYSPTEVAAIMSLVDTTDYTATPF